MKKTVQTDGEAKRVEFSCRYGAVISLTNQRIKSKWGTVNERTEVREAFFKVDGTTYQGTRTFRTAGGPYSETFPYNGQTFNSHKKVIEYILKTQVK